MLNKWNPNQTLPKNFAEKLCVENTLRETKLDKPSWREILKPKTKLCRKTLCWFLSSENKMQHTTPVCFNGEFLGIFAIAQLLYLKFFLYLYWLGVDSSPPKASRRNVVCNIFSELTPKASLLFFPQEIYWNCYLKILRDSWKPNRTLSIHLLLKLLFL